MAAPKYIVVRGKDVRAIVGHAISTTYDKINPNSPRYDPSFPKPVRIGPNSVGWILHELEAWVESRIRASRPGDHPISSPELTDQVTACAKVVEDMPRTEQRQSLSGWGTGYQSPNGGNRWG